MTVRLYPLLGDICVTVFQLLLCTEMITLRKNDRKTRSLMYVGCIGILGLFVAAIGPLGLPASGASPIFIGIPSILLFYPLSKYRDARFFLNICFVSTIGMMLGFLFRYVGMLFGSKVGLAAVPPMAIALAVVFLFGKPAFTAYRRLVEHRGSGWLSIVSSAYLIYGALAFLAVYPKPMVERPEYGICYLVFCLVVVSCYAVAISSIKKNQKLYEQSEQLKKEMYWHQMAYVDALTGLRNRMAYMERINELERTRTPDDTIGVMVFDLDEFKLINDDCGHSVGDMVLKDAAAMLLRIFSGEDCAVYRIGGDEFAVLTTGVTEERLRSELEELEGCEERAMPYTISAGYSMVRPRDKNGVEQAFVRADQMMYANKQNRGVRRT